MKRNGLFFILFFSIGHAYAQVNTIGLPEIINYSRQQYGAGTQNWDVKKDRKGMMYFANNDGLLSFDGTHWRIHPLPNKSIVRSVEIGNDNRIYVGGQEELGYFYPGAKGNLEYHSLKEMIPKDETSFADVWDIIAYDRQVFFRSNRKIFLYANDRITVFKSIDWRFLGISNGELIAQEYERGLLVFRNGAWTPFLRQSSLEADYRVSAIVSLGKDSSLLTTKKHVYILTGDNIRPYDDGALGMIATQKIYAAAKVDDDRFALATNLGGCYVVDRLGNLVQRLSKQDGIQNNNILSVFVDEDKNLWLGLDNGIDFIAYGSAIKRIYPDPENKYTGYTSIIYNGELYIGTSAGVFHAPINKSRDLSFVQSTFSMVENTRGQVWNLSEVNGKLLVGHNDGAFEIRDNVAYPVDPTSGFWTFQPLGNVLPSSRIFAGCYNGINFYDYKDGKFINPGLHAHFESARFVVNDNGMLWIAHPYKGLYTVNFDSANFPRARTYTDTKGILSANNNYLFRVGNKTILSTEKGIFELDPNKKDFIPSDYYRRIFGNINPSYLKEDRFGNVWFVYDKKLGVIDQTSSQPEIRYIPELNNKITGSGYEFIDAVNANNIFIAAEDGFFHLDYEKYKTEQHAFNILITSVKSVNKSDSLVYGGYNYTEPGSKSPAKISADWSSFHFEYSATLYGITNLEYSYYLEGFDRTWSPWNKKTEKDYTNLPPGTYSFMVKARNSPGKETAASIYTFTILPAWYQTYWAYAFYLILLGCIGYLVYKRQQKIFFEQQEKHEAEQKQMQYLHQLERDKIEKEIVKLNNEKLEAEIQHKNTELASSAMHLLQKGEMLGKIKEELQKISKNNDQEKKGENFKKIARILGEEDKMDADWEQFAQHFDKVHSDFLVDLKRKYPALSANEMKLCAYLRMNLSTKEIAQLMNISTRGVEVSRYRLRKKLQLETAVNLFDFLIKM
jgi:DNA-binding CsgD family transcriptional regulator